MFQVLSSSRIVVFSLAGVFLSLTACGGGGGSSSSDAVASIADLQFESGVFPDADNFKSSCQNPRSGVSSVTGVAFDDRAGSVLEENFWLRSWTNDTYFWYDEVVDIAPSLFTTPQYFDLLKTNEITPSGKDKDEFHFSVPTDDWEALSQTGISVNYGVQFAVISGTTPREIRVAFTEPNAFADLANVERGDTILAVDGIDVNDNTQAGINTLNAGLAPSDIGESHDFVFRKVDGTITSVTLTAGTVTLTSVQEVNTFTTDAGNVGYFLFNDHIATSETELVDAFRDLESQGVDDLVLDLRYNGGGFLAIASQVAYMITGSEATENQTFEQLRFNDKHPSINPVTGRLNDPMPFFDESLGFSVSPGQPLPTLNLDRVFVLTTGSTCSASESIINGLRGIGVEVVQIGSTSCGKPFGFYATDNCGTTYFSVQFQSVNALGFGDYADGFAPQGSTSVGSIILPGCVVEDDFSVALGNPEENMLAMALDYQVTGQCSTTLAQSQNAKASSPKTGDSQLIKTIWQENRIIRNSQSFEF